MSELPPGFVLDQQPQAAVGLPDGFVLDQPSVTGDVARSGGIGLAKGAIGLAGLPGDAGGLLNNYVYNPIMSAMGIPGAYQKIPTLVGSADIQRGIEKLTGKFYEPKTTAGEYAQTVGEFVPAALFGPGGVTRKLATQAVIPGVASEAAGQATQGTAGEPYARVAGALAGGGIGSLASKTAEVAAPTVDALKRSASASYKDARTSGLEINPASVDNLAAKISSELVTDGLTSRNAPQVLGRGGAIEALRNPPAGAKFTAQNFENARQELNQIANSAAMRGTPEADAASRAIGHLDDFLANIKPSDVAAGDAAAARAAFEEARGNWAAAKRTEMVNSKVDLAELRADVRNSGKNIGNSIRQRIVDVLDPTKPWRQRGYSADEIAQMRKIAEGTFTGNTLRHVSNMLGGGGGIGQAAVGALGGALSGGGNEGTAAGAILPMALGALTRGRYNSLVRKQGARLGESVANRSPLGKSMAASAPKPPPRLTAKQTALLNALMSSTATNGLVRTNPYSTR